MNVDRHAAGASAVWSARWTGTFTPTVSGLQRISFSGNGIARVYIDGRLVINSANQLTIAAVDLPAGQAGADPRGVRRQVAVPGVPPPRITMGWSPPDAAQWQAAIDAAHAADVAVVFVNDIRTEGADLSTLKLPGDQDNLIEAVAAVNPRTVVVLNTGGPVLTPWRDNVAGDLRGLVSGPGERRRDRLAAVRRRQPVGQAAGDVPAQRRPGTAHEP